MTADNLPRGVELLKDLELSTSGPYSTFATYCLRWSSDGQRLGAVGTDRSISIWAFNKDHADSPLGLQRRIRGMTKAGTSVALSPDLEIVAGQYHSRIVGLWDTTKSKLIRTLEGHAGGVRIVAWSPDGRHLASGSDDGAVKIWDSIDGRQICQFQPFRKFRRSDPVPADVSDWIRFGHDGPGITAIRWSGDGQLVAAGFANGLIQLFDVKAQMDRHRLEGHRGPVRCLEFISSSVVASGSEDHSVRIWDLESGRQKVILEGHFGSVFSLSRSCDAGMLASHSRDGTLRLWRCDSWEAVAILDVPFASRSSFDPKVSSVAFHPQNSTLGALIGSDHISVWGLDRRELFQSPTPEAHISYKNAKIVVVGDTSVGKSSLSMVLVGEPFQPTESTHGRKVWSYDSYKAELAQGTEETRELLLWDLAGQPGYRVFHQLHLNEVAVGLVLFDSRSETDPFTGVAYWARALDQATRGFPVVKILVAARVDRGGPPVSRARIQEIQRRYGFSSYIETSASRGDGIHELNDSIREAILWEQLPLVSAPEVFHDMKSFLAETKEAGSRLISADKLFEDYLRLRGGGAPPEIFATCLGRLEAAGLTKRLSFGGLVLLQPEFLDDYCAWLALAARDEPDGLGFISEREALAGALKMDRTRPFAGRPSEERLMLLATVHEVVERDIAFREETDRGAMLIFPSELRADMPHYPGGYLRSVTFVFEGPVRAIYATLAVRLINSLAFRKTALYRNAAVFRTVQSQECGFAVEYPDVANDALGRIVAFFSTDCEKDIKLLFLRYINQHLERLAFARSVRRERVYQCACGYEIPLDSVRARQSRGEHTAICPDCGRHSAIDDLAEQSAEYDLRIDHMEEDATGEQDRQKRLSVLPERERGREFDVFLCHNSVDKPTVRHLARKLRGHGVLPWLDEEGILAGTQFAPEIERLLNEVPAVAVIVGQHAMGRWQKQEYYAFLQRFVEHRDGAGRRRLVLIPVLLPGTVPDLELPPFLRGFNFVDFRRGGIDDRDELRRLVGAIFADPAFH
jgi:small GTP-binding protein